MRLSPTVHSAVLSAAAFAGLLLAAAPAQSQPIASATPAPTTTPSGTPAAAGDVSVTTNPPVGQVGPGTDSSHAVNPAPGATGPYVGHSENAFYDVQSRIDRVERRAQTQLNGARQRQAMADVRSIRAELATQKARHSGELRDWDRENLNHRLDQLEAKIGAARAPHGA